MQLENTLRQGPHSASAPAFLDVRALRLLLILYALTISLPGLFSLPPGDRDESRFAQATKQMIETGNYVQIMNGTEARNKKPIGIYWLQAPFVLAAGTPLANPIWPYRLPSVLGAIAAVLATFEIGMVFWRGPAIGALAGTMLAASVILAVETHIAKTDAALLGATTTAMAILSRAWVGVIIKRWQAALFWLALGAGILIKGPITPMVVGLTAVVASVSVRRGGWLRALKPAWGVPLLLVTVLPWFVAIGIASHGRFFAEALGGDLGRKLAGGEESHGGFPGLHLLLLPLLCFPATLPVLRALPAALRERRAPANTFLLAWIIPSWIVFEAVPTKLPHYTLPLYPALFLLAANATLAKIKTPTPAWVRVTSRAALGVAALILGGGAVALPIYLHAAIWLGLPALAACGLVASLAWRQRLVWAFAASPLLYTAILWLELPNLQPLWIAPRVETLLRTEWPGWNPLGKGLAVAGYAEPSLMFLAGTNLSNLPNGAEAATELADGTASAVLLTDADTPGFDLKASRLGLSPIRRGEVRGFNYSRGRWVGLSLYTR
jgi:4-amino-4-deoxy-L-arabinose transferase-like glycosyltransferase